MLRRHGLLVFPPLMARAQATLAMASDVPVVESAEQAVAGLLAHSPSHEDARVNHPREKAHLDNEVVLTEVGEVGGESLVDGVATLRHRRAVGHRPGWIPVRIINVGALVLVPSVVSPVHARRSVRRVHQPWHSPRGVPRQLTSGVVVHDSGKKWEVLHQ